MPRFAYVNGRYLPHAQAAVHIEDRGYQFADGAYEVMPVRAGRIIDEEPHLDRLDYSLAAVRIRWPVSRPVLTLLLRELIARNRLRRGVVYLQVTRGQAPREHKFPRDVKPSLVITTLRLGPPPATALEPGVAIITIPDIRWRRCDIKSIALLPNVLGKQQAVDAGAYEAWMVDDDGFVTEGTSTNAWIVTADRQLITRSLSHAILGGITRAGLLRMARSEGIEVVERSFTLSEARAAREAFLTSSSHFLLPVARIDGAPVGDGRPGPLTRSLRVLYLSAVGTSDA